MKDGTFILSSGSQFPLPAKYTVRESRRKDSLTPLIISTYRRKGQKTCHFVQTPDMMEQSERFGIFVPRGLKAGDVLRIMWIDKTSACAMPVELLRPGQIFISWLYATDCSGDLAKLKREELSDLVKRQTDLIPKVGIQPGCAVVIPESTLYLEASLQLGPLFACKTGRKASGLIIVTYINEELSNEKVAVVSHAERFGKQPGGYVVIPKGKYTLAMEDEIKDLVSTCFSGKWSFM